MKKLAQDVFSLPECPEWALSAAVDDNGVGTYYSDTAECLEAVKVCGSGFWIYREGGNKSFEVQAIGNGFDPTDWQNSAIDREVVK